MTDIQTNATNVKSNSNTRTCKLCNAQVSKVSWWAHKNTAKHKNNLKLLENSKTEENIDKLRKENDRLKEKIEELLLIIEQKDQTNKRT